MSTRVWLHRMRPCLQHCHGGKIPGKAELFAINAVNWISFVGYAFKVVGFLWSLWIALQ